jgi:hypothetical protein
MLLTEFDYDKLMQRHYGSKESALGAMVISFNLYYKKRGNWIARKRAKSCISIIRRLRTAKIVSSNW